MYLYQVAPEKGQHNTTIQTHDAQYRPAQAIFSTFRSQPPWATGSSYVNQDENGLTSEKVNRSE